MLQNFAYYAQFMSHVYKALCSTNSTLHFPLILLKLENNEYISNLSSLSTVQHTIKNSSIHVYKRFEFISVAFATLVNTHFDKILSKDSPKSHNPVNVYIYTNFVNCAGNFCVLCWHYAQCFCHPIILKLCWHNRLKPIIKRVF